MWTKHVEFLAYVQTSWVSYPTVGGMRSLYYKLQRLKKDLRDLNTAVFGNVFDHLHHSEQEIQRYESQFDHNPTPESRMEYHAAQA